MLASRTIKSTLKYSIKSLGAPGKAGGAEAAISKATPKSVSPFHNDWRFAWSRFKTETKLKFRQNKTPIIVCLAFWLSGVCYYGYFEPPNASFFRRFFQVLFSSLAVRTPSPESASDFSNFYQLCWPIFLEVVVFGLVATSMMAHYNPVVVCQMTAEGLSDHTVVVGCEHLGDKIVDHLRMNGVKYCVVDESVDKVASLVKIWEPVVVGNPTDPSTLKSARVQYCSEVFVVLNSLHTAILVCFQIRSMNKNCKIYVQVYEHEEFKEYFSHEPLRAYTFSTSRWAVKSVMQWIKEETPAEKAAKKRPYPLKKQFSVILPPSFRYSLTDVFKETERPAAATPGSSHSLPIIKSRSKSLSSDATTPAPPPQVHKAVAVIGSSNLARRIVAAVGEETLREAYWAELSTEGIFGDLDHIKGKVKTVALSHQMLFNLEEFIPFDTVSYVFVCWNRESQFSDIVFLLMMLSSKFPHVCSYVQIPDENLANIIGSLNGIPFSTSSYAFKKLQEEVPPTSGLVQYFHPEDRAAEKKKA